MPSAWVTCVLAQRPLSWGHPPFTPTPCLCTPSPVSLPGLRRGDAPLSSLRPPGRCPAPSRGKLTLASGAPSRRLLARWLQAQGPEGLSRRLVALGDPSTFRASACGAARATVCARATSALHRGRGPRLARPRAHRPRGSAEKQPAQHAGFPSLRSRHGNPCNSDRSLSSPVSPPGWKLQLATSTVCPAPGTEHGLGELTAGATRGAAVSLPCLSWKGTRDRS